MSRHLKKGGVLVDYSRYFNRVGISTSTSPYNNADPMTVGFLLEIARQNTLRFHDDIAPQIQCEKLLDNRNFLRSPLSRSLRWTDYFPVNVLLLFGESVLKGLGAVISAPYRWSINKFRQSDGDHYGWLPLVLVTGAVNLFVSQPLFFLGDVCKHLRGWVGGVLRFGWGVLKGSYNAFRARPGEGWQVFRNAVTPGLEEIVGNSLRLLGDAVVGGLCYGVSLLTGGVAAPFLIPAASVVQSSLISATAAQVSTTAGMLAIQGAVSRVVSFSISAKIKSVSTKIKEWFAEKFNVNIGNAQVAEKGQAAETKSGGLTQSLAPEIDRPPLLEEVQTSRRSNASQEGFSKSIRFSIWSDNGREDTELSEDVDIPSRSPSYSCRSI